MSGIQLRLLTIVLAAPGALASLAHPAVAAAESHTTVDEYPQLISYPRGQRVGIGFDRRRVANRCWVQGIGIVIVCSRWALFLRD